MRRRREGRGAGDSMDFRELRGRPLHLASQPYLPKPSAIEERWPTFWWPHLLAQAICDWSRNLLTPCLPQETSRVNKSGGTMRCWAGLEWPQRRHFNLQGTCLEEGGSGIGPRPFQRRAGTGWRLRGAPRGVAEKWGQLGEGEEGKVGSMSSVLRP